MLTTHTLSLRLPGRATPPRPTSPLAPLLPQAPLAPLRDALLVQPGELPRRRTSQAGIRIVSEMSAKTATVAVHTYIRMLLVVKDVTVTTIPLLQQPPIHPGAVIGGEAIGENVFSVLAV